MSDADPGHEAEPGPPERLAPTDGDGDPTVVPFAGLRRNARALAGGFILLIAIGFLVPDLSPPLMEPPAAELLRGRIVEVLPAGDDVTAPDVRIQIGVGPRRGETVDGSVQRTPGQGDLPRYDVGDEVIINASLEPGNVFISVADLYRVPVLGLLLAVFAVAVAVVGGWRGVRSLIALGLTLAVVVKIVVPLILAGWDPAIVAIVAATGVTFATILLTEGAKPQTITAALGTVGALALTGVLAVGFDMMARFTALRGSGDATDLQAIGLTGVDLGGLILAAIILGALGVLHDVTVTQAAIVTELHAANPSLRGLQLARRAMNVGRSHFASTVNALVLAYVGASLPILVLFAAGRQDPLLTASTEAVAIEVVRALVGSIGIVAAVPLTTAIGVTLINRRLPFVLAEHPLARGWDG